MHRVSNHVHFVDPVTCQVAELSVDKYHRQEFRAVVRPPILHTSTNFQSVQRRMHAFGVMRR